MTGYWDAPISNGFYNNPPDQKREAVLKVRDRAGFTYERRVTRLGYVSAREAATLLSIPVMSIYRWIRSKKLPSKSRNGVSIVRLADLYPIAKEKGLAVRTTGTFLVSPPTLEGGPTPTPSDARRVGGKKRWKGE